MSTQQAAAPKPSPKPSVPGAGDDKFLRWIWSGLLVGIVVMVGLLVPVTMRGCQLTDAPGYGLVDSPGKLTGINGLGVFERMCAAADIRATTATKLSLRLERSDAIVLVSDTLAPPSAEARDWLEGWLSRSSGRTVIYFGRDFNAEVYYRQQTLDAVPADKRDDAERNLAFVESEEYQLRHRNVSGNPFCRWFTIRTAESPKVIDSFKGPWASRLPKDSAGWPVTSWLDPPDSNEAPKAPTWPTKTATTTNAWTSGVSSTQSSSYRTRWMESEIDSDEEWDKEWEKAPDAEVLLEDRDGRTLVARLTSDRFADSQILLVANGFPFLNGSLVEPTSRAVARAIVEELGPADRLTFVRYDDSGLLISDIDEEENGPAGMQMLTVWPMSMITMHAALLGVLICIILLPILGRPQPGRSSSLSNFGNHVESTGKLLQRAGDRIFAQRMIRQYFQQVRDEAPPAWLDPVDVSASEALPQQTTPGTSTKPQLASSTAPALSGAATNTSTGGTNPIETQQQAVVAKPVHVPKPPPFKSPSDSSPT